MILPVFEKIYIDKESENSEVAERVRQLYSAEIIVSASPQDEALYKKGPMNAEEFNRSKKTLWLTTFKGQFFKRCPGATQKKSLTCCNYYVLNLGSQCNMNCSYCYLQSYLNSHVTKVFTNIDDALNELREMAQTFSAHPFRVGTGEVIDSLSLDEVTLYSRKLISFFNEFPNWIVEFKTKSNKVDQVIPLLAGRSTPPILLNVKSTVRPAYMSALMRLKNV